MLSRCPKDIVTLIGEQLHRYHTMQLINEYKERVRIKYIWDEPYILFDDHVVNNRNLEPNSYEYECYSQPSGVYAYIYRICGTTNVQRWVAESILPPRYMYSKGDLRQINMDY